MKINNHTILQWLPQTFDYLNSIHQLDQHLCLYCSIRCSIGIVHRDYTFCARTHTPSAQLEEGEGWAGLKTCKRLRTPASQAELWANFLTKCYQYIKNIICCAKRRGDQVSSSEISFPLCHLWRRYGHAKLASAMNDPYLWKLLSQSPRPSRFPSSTTTINHHHTPLNLHSISSCSKHVLL